MLSRYDKPRVLFYSLLLSSLLFSYITACGNNGGTVTAEQTAGAITVTVKANIVSSVTPEKGTVPCSFSFEFNYTAGANESLIAQETISDLQFKCDASGYPVTGQGIETTFTFDPISSPAVLEGGVIQVFFAKKGASILDDALLNFYSDSFDFVPQECIETGNCTFEFEASNINETIFKSGLLDLSCPALIFINSICTCLDTQLLSQLGCKSGGGGEKAVCGNGKLETGEICEDPCTSGKCVTCKVGSTCAPAKTKGECTCVADPGAVCGNSQSEGDEQCGEPDLPGCIPPKTCVDCQCIIESLCKNGVVDEGEECETCPPEMECGPLPTCDVGDSCVDCQCLGPPCTACHFPPCPPENVVGSCSDGCDNDGDGSTDCDDHLDCDCSQSCGAPPCVCPVCGPGNVCDVEACCICKLAS